MTREEREQWLLLLCDRVAGAKARYKEKNDLENMIRGVNALASKEPAKTREARELLAELVREGALSEDRLWRDLVITAAAEIEDEIINSIPGPN